MAVVRAQCSCIINPTEPADTMMITPHFNFTVGLGDYQDFAEELALALQGWQSVSSPARKWNVKLYDVAGAAPHYPLGDFTTPTGVTTELTWPRELALCLSFYSEHNRPRWRGRCYVCPGWMFSGTGMDVRPTQTVIDKVMALGVILKDAGGADVDWSVWSRADATARAVTTYWCDNEWDVQRRRGQKSTGRTVATTTEMS